MASVINNLFGAKPSANPESTQAAGDADFADFDQAADPSPAPIVPETSMANTFWCRADHTALHQVAKKWMRAHAAPLTSEFASVGFTGVPPSVADKKGDELLQALIDTNTRQGDSLIRENSLFEFATYATGRANVAFLDVKLTLVKRFNPLTVLFETAFAFFTDVATETQDILEATLYPFDGKEALTVPGMPGAAELRSKDSKSAFDGFVWALVHKERMKQVRDDRFDVSLTVTKDHAKLPNWLTVMTESAEITDALLTPELIKAAGLAGDLLEYLIITDQPVEKPKTLNDTTPRKRVHLRYRLPSDNDYSKLVPLFKYFLRVTDRLVQAPRFRPEVLRKVKAARDATARQIQKADEEERAEERAAERERLKKAKRDQELNALDAKAQKKYLEREREKEMKKSMKKQTTRA
ncbi:hypothetical protein CHGG_02978 [Chaetomium globosum CBS 148.51]|uniref:DUF1682 domain protein n=1 Tax=Chaetomium globosum (strain ATCC 6205 / CBS 148.51 / DSM 1962 / NBRC 6347 / NRRL 1970) TaxID=306901 RepID=Q2H9X6_CHAGB|nr:uncharacterized protein CHGG_02978 [Chaetomium globosum CBS 148.51]EAQ91043.1 hypothetical protein CHGG_02978 [Chaetomium globosum CBS 148.51]